MAFDIAAERERMFKQKKEPLDGPDLEDLCVNRLDQAAPKSERKRLWALCVRGGFDSAKPYKYYAGVANFNGQKLTYY